MRNADEGEKRAVDADVTAEPGPRQPGRRRDSELRGVLTPDKVADHLAGEVAHRAGRHALQHAEHRRLQSDSRHTHRVLAPPHDDEQFARFIERRRVHRVVEPDEVSDNAPAVNVGLRISPADARAHLTEPIEHDDRKAHEREGHVLLADRLSVLRRPERGLLRGPILDGAADGGVEEPHTHRRGDALASDPQAAGRHRIENELPRFEEAAARVTREGRGEVQDTSEAFGEVALRHRLVEEEEPNLHSPALEEMLPTQNEFAVGPGWEGARLADVVAHRRRKLVRRRLVVQDEGAQDAERGAGLAGRLERFDCLVGLWVADAALLVEEGVRPACAGCRGGAHSGPFGSVPASNVSTWRRLNGGARRPRSCWRDRKTVAM